MCGGVGGGERERKVSLYRVKRSYRKFSNVPGSIFESGIFLIDYNMAIPSQKYMKTE